MQNVVQFAGHLNFIMEHRLIKKKEGNVACVVKGAE